MKRMGTRRRFAILLCGGLGLAGCAVDSVAESDWRSWEPERRFQDLWYAPGTTQWAALDQRGGLWINGERQSNAAQGYQHLDGRVVASGDWRLALAEQSSNEVHVLTVRDGQVMAGNTIPAPDYEVAGLCLYQDRDGLLSVFLLDERGGADQWLINEMVAPLRHLVLPPEVQACRVDDDDGDLYVSEERVGVWRYAANAERDPERRVVDMVAPRGGLRLGAAGLAVIPDGLAVLDKDAGTLHLYRDGEPVGAAITVPAQKEPEKLAALWRNGELTLVVLDDEGSAARTMTLPWRAANPTFGNTDMAVVHAAAQTDPVARFGDAADDPAIWLHPEKPEHGRVLGTDKKAGLYVYDLLGRTRQFLPVGRLNNVDVRGDWAVASNRDHDSLQVFRIDTEGNVSNAGEIETTLKDIYGVCLYLAGADELHAIANGKNGEFEQYRLDLTGEAPSATLARRFRVDSQPEGCVADEVTGQLFVGEEDQAVWTLPADPEVPATLTKVMAVGEKLVADIEGLAIYAGEDHRYLVISSQGNDSYVVLDALPPYAYRGRFRIALDSRRGVDGVSETDGLEVTSVNLGGAYEEGLLVVQDGRNRLPQAPQNFKYVPWSAVREALNLTREARP
ncbi:phytase [Alcanivorax sp. 24]|uniref:phytase n=1 Tax=Alcanivorax sp. 24 TaxID=2545266 RepID=UPI001060439D|nr:phytase [Alcanivorax sp. 24]